MQIITPKLWPTLRDYMPTIQFLYYPMIPANGVTLVHGPPGCGKSAFAWGIANAISIGRPYLGIDTVPTNVLLVSNDMNVYGFKARWGEIFNPLFSFICTPRFNCTAPGFENNELYRAVKGHIETEKIGLVVVDALGGMHSGLTARDDETAMLVDAAIAKWFAPAGVLLLAHDRKTRYGHNGKPQEPSSEDFLGSQMWRANATSQIHMWKSSNHMSILQHDKSQVAAEMEDQIQLYIDLNGMAELYDEYKANEVAARFQRAVKVLGLGKATPTLQVEGVAKHCNVAIRTAYRWKSLGEG